MLNLSKVKYLGWRLVKFSLMSCSALFLIGYVFFAIYYHLVSFNLIVATAISLIPIFILYAIIAFWAFKFWENKNWRGYILLLFAPFVFFWLTSFIFYTFRGFSVQCTVNPFERIPEAFHSYSLNITDSFLDNEAKMQYLLTKDRLSGEIILAGDFNVNIPPCQKKVRITWDNKSTQSIVLKGLPNQKDIALPPGKSHSSVFIQEGVYPYLLNDYPKIIQVGQTTFGEQIKKNLQEFCQDNARGEVLVVFWSEMQNEEITDLFEKSGLKLIDKKPYNSYLAKPTGEKSLAEILLILKTNPQFGRMDYDCSFTKTEMD